MYVEPTAEDLKVRFPEFAPVSDTLVALILAEAIPMVGPSWIERDRRPAQLYLAAHLLAMEGEPGRTTTGNGVAVSGPVKRRKVGDVETEFTGAASSAGGSTPIYAQTLYGQRYLNLLRLNFPPVAVV